MTNYIELHAHSAYSLLRGTASPEALLAEAARLGMPGLALTDHNNVYGAISFQKAAQALGLQPILGAELTSRAPIRRSRSPFLPDASGRGGGREGVSIQTASSGIALDAPLRTGGIYGGSKGRVRGKKLPLSPCGRGG